MKFVNGIIVIFVLFSIANSQEENPDVAAEEGEQIAAAFNNEDDPQIEAALFNRDRDTSNSLANRIRDRVNRLGLVAQGIGQIIDMSQNAPPIAPAVEFAEEIVEE